MKGGQLLRNHMEMNDFLYLDAWARSAPGLGGVWARNCRPVVWVNYCKTNEKTTINHFICSRAWARSGRGLGEVRPILAEAKRELQGQVL